MDPFINCDGCGCAVTGKELIEVEDQHLGCPHCSTIIFRRKVKRPKPSKAWVNRFRDHTKPMTIEEGDVVGMTRDYHTAALKSGLIPKKTPFHTSGVVTQVNHKTNVARVEWPEGVMPMSFHVHYMSEIYIKPNLTMKRQREAGNTNG